MERREFALSWDVVQLVLQHMESGDILRTVQVGLCAITSATTMFSKVFATDLHPVRLELAKRHGATALPLAELKTALAEATDGKGADAVLEVVGVEGAVRTGMELVRPYGVLSSVGVHGSERKLDGDLLYGKK
jgi:threonine dehydrogenase-like Zn-dependent dehydrogenase